MNAASKASIGQAIDQVLSALNDLEKREQEIVVSTICSILEIVPTSAYARGMATSASTGATREPAAVLPSGAIHRSSGGHTIGEQAVDIRTLKEQKQPANVLQMACVVAFYLQEHAPTEEKTREVTAADLERLFKQAGYKLPSRMQQVLVDAKGAGYFESVDRGKYKLTRVGYNLVTHSLPKAASK